ncbi:hypothetical protein KYJ26_14315 [Bacillus sp. MCCB 382]|uniref:hypothetical protein n=1 Tax=Bacillus sp. MCCB 382 TaxID=2860197 RepID=UPI001C55F18C|nr:hypothetical protein [Bacillus sp. MCCB 382]
MKTNVLKTEEQFLDTYHEIRGLTDDKEVQDLLDKMLNLAADFVDASVMQYKEQLINHINS